MRVVTGTQMSKIDKHSIEQLGIPSIVLMENAALKLAAHIEAYLGQKPQLSKEVLIIAGKGNNAGDAFAAARHLHIKGYGVKLYCIFEKAVFAGDAKTTLDIAAALGLEIKYLTGGCEFIELTRDIKEAQIVVDGIFGTGFKGEIEGHIARVVELVNAHSKYTVSIDIASGIDSAAGRISASCIKAHKTVTFELPKIGQLTYPGIEYTGCLAVESIGIPRQAIESAEIQTFLTEAVMVRDILPRRNADFNKGNCGKAVIITGSAGMAGSGCLSSKACLKTGSGLVYVAAPASMINIYQSVVPEAIAIGLEEENGILSLQSTDKICGTIKKCDVVAIGPGLSADKCIYCILESIADKIDVPVVLDADALNAAANDTGIFKKFRNEVVITPHPGEMSRLTGLETNYIQSNRLEAARKYAELWDVIVVLKGANTIIADPKGNAYINPTGNAGMATAGSGDSLTGIITSLAGQGAPALEAAVAGAYLHGLAGDMAAEEKGQYGLTAMDIVEYIPYAIKKVLNF